MMIPEEVARDFHEIPEDVIKKGAEMFGGDQNNFNQLLFRAEVFRKAGLEPKFMANPDHTILLVTCEETWLKKLH